MSGRAMRRQRTRRGTFAAPEPLELDFCDLDDFTEGELANLQRKDVPPRESDKRSDRFPGRGGS